MPDEQLLTTDDVSLKLKCSPRHVRRLAEREAMPQPVRLGALLRWRCNDIDGWIAEGCPGTAETRKGQAR